MPRQAAKIRRATSWGRLVPLVLLALAAACAGGSQEPAGEAPIDREVFIETYVELRIAALVARDFVLLPEQREEILARHGVDGESLLRFADFHGRDVDFMNEVWSAVESRIEEAEPFGDGM